MSMGAITLTFTVSAAWCRRAGLSKLHCYCLAGDLWSWGHFNRIIQCSALGSFKTEGIILNKVFHHMCWFNLFAHRPNLSSHQNIHLIYSVFSFIIVVFVCFQHTFTPNRLVSGYFEHILGSNIQSISIIVIFVIGNKKILFIIIFYVIFLETRLENFYSILQKKTFKSLYSFTHVSIL